MPLRLHSVDRQFAHFCRTGDAETLGRVFDAAAAELLHVAAWLSGIRAGPDARDWRAARHREGDGRVPARGT
jgi:hypothetical protein